MLDAGKIIQGLRTEQGLGICELADKSGVHYATISSIEHERHGTRLFSFECLLEAMGYELQVVPKHEHMD